MHRYRAPQTMLQMHPKQKPLRPLTRPIFDSSMPVSYLVLFLSLWHRQVLRKRMIYPRVKCSSIPALKAPCSSSMVIPLLYLSSASCLPSNKHHPLLAIPLVIWKRTRDQWQSCCHGTVYGCRVEICCKARECQSLLASSQYCCNLCCLTVSTAESDLEEATQYLREGKYTFFIFIYVDILYRLYYNSPHPSPQYHFNCSTLK